MVNYDDLVNSLSSNPRDIVTVPMNNRKGKWFMLLQRMALFL